MSCRAEAPARAGAPRTCVATLLIGVTSHRNLVAGELGGLRAQVAALLRRLRAEFPHLPLTVLSALAAGGDQLVAEEALSVGARLIAPLPLPRAEYARDFGDAASRARFEALCDAAEVLELPLPVPARAGEASPRDLHYAQAGRYIAAHCDILIALWDGRHSGLPGGTAEVVDGCLRAGAEPDFGAADLFTRMGTGACVVHHIVCSREASDGAPSPPLQPLQAFWLDGRTVWPGSAPMPATLQQRLRRVAELNADCARHAASIGGVQQRTRQCLSPDAFAPDAAFVATDWLALHFQRRVEFTLRAMYMLAALMGMALMLYADFTAQDRMIFVFLALFAAGAALDAVARRRAWHRKYLDYRALAEALRIRNWWHLAGLGAAASTTAGYEPVGQMHDVHLGWLRSVLCSAELDASLREHRRRAAPDLGAVIDQWIGRAGVGGQLRYYERCIAERGRRHHLTEAIGTASLWCSIAISVFLAAFVLQLGDDTKRDLVAVMGVLSIVAAVREAYAYRKADRDLATQYRLMQRIYARARAALDAVQAPAAKRRILRSLAATAANEQTRWALMHRDRPIERARL